MPKQSPKIPREIQELRSVYRRAQERLCDVIIKQEAKGNVTKYREEILEQVNKEIYALDKFAQKWTNENVDKHYRKGAEQVYKEFRRANIDVGDIAVDPRRIQIMAANALDEFTEAHRFVGRVINDEIRAASIEAVAEKLSAGDTVRQAKKNLLKKMSDRGIVAIKDKRGRQMRLDAYAELVARSTTREATNRATMEQVQELGHDLVQMSEHSPTCPICAPLQGRVYSISGTHPDYPALKVAYSGRHANIHPNCRHVLTPYFEKFDPNPQRTKEKSQRPFDIDPRSKRQKEAYEKAQEKNRQLNNDRKQWERYRMTMPDKTPKTFSAFRRSKKVNGPKYRELESEYRSIMQQRRTAKAAEEFVPAATVNEARELIREKLGAKKVTMTKFDLDVLNEFGRGTDATIRQIPQLRGFVDEVTTTSSERAFGMYKVKDWKQGRPIEKNIRMSTKVAADIKTFNAAMERGIAKNIHPKGFTPAHVMAHEQAHAIENMILLKEMGIDYTKPMTVKEWNSFIKKANGNDKAREITNEAFKNMGYNPDWRTQTKEESKAIYNVVKELGRYAIEGGKGELYAQAMADAIMSKSPRTFSKEVLKETKRRLR